MGKLLEFEYNLLQVCVYESPHKKTIVGHLNEMTFANKKYHFSLQKIYIYIFQIKNII